MKSLLDSMISIVENDTLSHDMHQSTSKDEESAWEEEYDAPVGDKEGAAEVTAEGEESKHDDSTDDAMDRRAALKRVGPSDIFFLLGGGGGKKISPHPYLFFRVSTCHVSQRNRPAKKKSPRQEEVRRA